MGRPTMDGLDFACIEEDERLSLEKEFMKEEVIPVLREMEGRSEERRVGKECSS